MTRITGLGVRPSRTTGMEMVAMVRLLVTKVTALSMTVMSSVYWPG